MKLHLPKLKLSYRTLKNVILPMLAMVLFLGAFITFINSNKTAHQEAVNSQRAVSNHTQTLNQINNVVQQIESNNQTNHDTTIRYLQCVIDLLLTTPQPTKAQANACLSGAGLADPAPVVTTPSTPPKVSGAVVAPTAQPSSQSVASPSSSSPSAPSPSPTPSSGTSQPGVIRQVINFLGL